jgi:hypothetical protein
VTSTEYESDAALGTRLAVSAPCVGVAAVATIAACQTVDACNANRSVLGVIGRAVAVCVGGIAARSRAARALLAAIDAKPSKTPEAAITDDFVDCEGASRG